MSSLFVPFLQKIIRNSSKQKAPIVNQESYKLRKSSVLVDSSLGCSVRKLQHESQSKLPRFPPVETEEGMVIPFGETLTPKGNLRRSKLKKIIDESSDLTETFMSNRATPKG